MRVRVISWEKSEQKNWTGSKTLDVVEKDARVIQAYRDEDGFWMELANGWVEIDGLHEIHAGTAKELRRRYAEIKPCNCEECREAAEYKGES